MAVGKSQTMVYMPATKNPSPSVQGPFRAASHLYLIGPGDEVYERDLLREPGRLRPWLNYIDDKRRSGRLIEQAFLLERACRAFPRSYKLWNLYLGLRTSHLDKQNPATQRSEFAKVNNLFERALILLNKMPRIWEMYLGFLMKQPLVTQTRRTFDRALRALPITQHARIWTLYIPFADSAGGDTAIKIWKRYLQLKPEQAEDIIELLVQNGKYTEAVQQYMSILNSPRFSSKEAKGPFEVWAEMLELIIDHAREVETGVDSGIDVDRIVRSGITRFRDQAGILWVGLARYWINSGYYEKARDVFEEGIKTVMTVRDFSIVFDAYADAEEAQIELKMQQQADRKRPDPAANVDIDIRLLRFEQLTDRRLFLLNDVKLRQNPNNIEEWKKRVALWSGNDQEIIQTYTDAIAAIHPKRATGLLHELWDDYAKFYEERKDLRSARAVMEKAVKVPYKSVNELADMWISWAEMELRNDQFDKAMEAMAKAVQAPKRSRVDYFDETLSPQQRVHKSWKLWSFYVDLVESVSSLDETRKVYERIFELRIATPQTVVNFANLLEENQYFEESFKIYERGLDLFSYPVAFELWNIYLTKAVDRQLHIERLRDLFEQALEGCPPKFAKSIYYAYGQLEEERGLARQAMRIYERATRAVADEDRKEMFDYYITKSVSNFGLASARPIYQRSIEVLTDKEAAAMCMRFADTERRLGEIERARAIFAHGSQFCDPRLFPDIWKEWEAFEHTYGGTAEYAELMRVKRSVVNVFKYGGFYLISICPSG